MHKTVEDFIKQFGGEKGKISFPVEHNHPVFPGDHTECGPDCAITGDRCCGGHVAGICIHCDAERLAENKKLRTMLRETVDELRQLHNHHYRDCNGGCPADDILQRAEVLLMGRGA